MKTGKEIYLFSFFSIFDIMNNRVYRMKKLNNKGFAITVILYGIVMMICMILLLTLSIMAGQRKNDKALIDNIKDDLNNVANNEFCATGLDEIDTTSHAAAPELIDGMIPVIYNECKDAWVKADPTAVWYNYSKQMWANAVTVSASTREKYEKIGVGETIDMNDINTMWVWIPRYEYQIPVGTAGNSSVCSWDNSLMCYPTPGDIKINFINKEQTTASQDYKLMSAFQFNGEEINGFWAAKFEPSGTIGSCTNDNCSEGDIQIKPNQISLTNKNVSTFYFATKSMKNNKFEDYGFEQIATSDIHMMKNTEWAAIAYLSQSIYGKYGNPTYTNEVGLEKKIYKNNVTTDANYGPGVTGCAGDIVDGAPIYANSCPDGFTYETDNGVKASTTGNISGIYDMVGGSLEYMMARYTDGTFTSDQSGFTSTNLPGSEYYDSYSNEDATSACNGSECFGHALSETTRWHSNAFQMPNAANRYLVRDGGGGINSNEQTGIFAVYQNTGAASTDRSFRIVIKPYS